ncbi:hypothetical protein ACFSQ7_38100 [Paenibacillus rhizoplanae]
MMAGDIDLKTLQSRIEQTKVGNTGWAFLLDKQGNYIAGPDAEKNMQLKITAEKKRKSVRSGSGNAPAESGNGNLCRFRRDHSDVL